MPVSQEHIEELRKARKALVDIRHDWAKVLAGGYQRGKTEDVIKSIIEVEQAIEAIDHAILDEGKGATGP